MDLGTARAAMQPAGELGEFVLGTHRVDFDAAVIEVADVPREPEFYRGALRKIAEAYTLNAAANQPAPGAPRVRCFATHATAVFRISCTNES